MGFLEVTLHTLSILFSIILVGIILYIFSTLLSLLLAPFLPYFIKLYSTIIKPVVSWVLNPLVRVLNFFKNMLRPYLAPLLLWIYNSFYTVFIQLYKVILLLYSCCLFLFNVASRYLYVSYCTNNVLLKTIFVVFCVFGIFSCADSLVVSWFSYFDTHTNTLHNDVEVLTVSVLVQTYILYCFLYGYVYILFTYLSKYIDPVKWLMLVIAITAAIIPTIDLYLQITPYTILVVSLFEPLFISSGLYIYSYTYFQKNTIYIGKQLSYTLSTLLGSCIRVLHKQIQWVPVFKKSSYLGLYKSFKNKWPF